MYLLDKRGWPLHSGTLRPLLGLEPGHHLPAGGSPPVDIDGTRVWVEPRTPGTGRGHHARHRTMCGCPVCGKVLTAGCLNQHMGRMHHGEWMAELIRLRSGGPR